MNFLVRDTKNPRKDPFLISQQGFEGLQAQFGGRYVRVNSHIEVSKLPDLVHIPSVQKVAMVEKKQEEVKKETPQQDIRHSVRSQRRRRK